VTWIGGYGISVEYQGLRKLAEKSRRRSRFFHAAGAKELSSASAFPKDFLSGYAER
jgi:hypothetical protein